MARSGRPSAPAIVVTVLVLIGVATAAWWLLPSLRPAAPDRNAASAPSTPGAPSSQETSAAPADSTFPPQRARDIEAALLSGDEPTTRSVLAIPAQQPLDPAFTQTLASLDAVTIDDATFQQDGTTAQVDAQVRTAGTETPWTLHLIQVDDAWLIAATTTR